MDGLQPPFSGALCLLMIESVFEKIDDSKYSELLEYLENGGDPNLVNKSHSDDYENGETLIFHAVIGAQLKVLELLINKGADVNYQISDNYFSHDCLAENPLSLALQCRFLMDYEKYDPVVKILEKSGAVDET